MAYGDLPGQEGYQDFFQDFLSNYDFSGSPWENNALFNPQYDADNPALPHLQGTWLDQYRNLAFGDAGRAHDALQDYQNLYTANLAQMQDYVGGIVPGMQERMDAYRGEMDSWVNKMLEARDQEQSNMAGYMDQMQDFRSDLAEAGAARTQGFMDIAGEYGDYMDKIEDWTKDAQKDIQHQLSRQVNKHQARLNQEYSKVENWMAKGEAELKSWTAKLENQNMLTASAAANGIIRDSNMTDQQIQFMDVPQEVKAQLTQQQSLRRGVAVTEAMADHSAKWGQTQFAMMQTTQQFYANAAQAQTNIANIQNAFSSTAIAAATQAAAIQTDIGKYGMSEYGRGLGGKLAATGQAIESAWQNAQMDVQLGQQIIEMGIQSDQRFTALTSGIAEFSTGALNFIEGAMMQAFQMEQQGMAQLSNLVGNFPTNTIAFADLLMADLSVNATLSELGWSETEAQSYGQIASGSPGLQVTDWPTYLSNMGIPADQWVNIPGFEGLPGQTNANTQGSATFTGGTGATA